MASEQAEIHLFIVNAISGQVVVFLLEKEPGVVEFPRLSVTAAEAASEDALQRRIREATGLDVEIGGFLDRAREGTDQAAGNRLLFARLLSGSPRVTLDHVGWEWVPGSTLATLPFAPKIMVDELKSFMNV